MAAFLLDNTNIELEINALNVERRTAFDELLRAQFDLGYFRLKSMLRRKGAKTARALRRIPYQRKGTSLYRKHLQRMEAPLLVFATLVATVTYQAVFNPPGGVWNDDYPPPSPVQNSVPKIGTDRLFPPQSRAAHLFIRKASTLPHVQLV